MAALLWFGSPSPAVAGPDRIPCVVLLLPQRADSAVSHAAIDGFRNRLVASMDRYVDLRIEHLDLLEAPTSPHLDATVEVLEAKYRSVHVDVVAAYRSEALALLLPRRHRLFPGAPVVFIEVAPEEIVRLGPLPADVTGALRTFDTAAALRDVADVLPGGRAITIVGGASLFDRQLEASFLAGARTLAPIPAVQSLVGLPLREQLSRLSTLPRDGVAVLTSFRADTDGRSLLADEVVRQIVASSTVPLFGFSRTWMGDGVVGGRMFDHEVVAGRAGDIAARILRGERPESIPADSAPATRLQFDGRQLHRWRIAHWRLPRGSEVLFEQPSLFQRHRTAVVTAGSVVGAQALLLGALLWERGRRRRTEAALGITEERYRTVANATSDVVYWMLPDRSLRFVSPSAMRLLGRSADALIAEPARLREAIAAEDRGLWDEAHARAFEDRQPASIEVRVSSGAAMRWLDIALTPITDDSGSDLGVRGAGRDITERKRSELALLGALYEIGRLRDRLEVDDTPAEPATSPEGPLPGILGTSDSMAYVSMRVRAVAPTVSTVLLLGETGVGKSQLARAIHDLSPRAEKTFVTLNCAALPAALVESELFGHEKGAFTGAHQRRLGRFETAHRGTLFLDEIAELPIELQGKLLRAVQDGEFERVGGSTTIRVDVRLIAATNASIEDRIRIGQFRQDLWYRINVFPITVPPLRKRQEDIPHLVLAFMARHCESLGRPMLEVTRATMKWLQNQPWPGNVRELDSFIQRSVIQSRGSRLELDQEGTVTEEAIDADEPPVRHGASVTLKDNERQLILETLEATAWRVHGRDGAADRLGINPSTLRSRMRKLGIERPAHGSWQRHAD